MIDLSKYDEMIFATGNENKLREVKMILNLPIPIKSIKEAGVDVDIVEDGMTFEENALIKATTLCKVTGLPALADDSGLVVDALGGAPGIYSARYMGEETSYRIKNQHIIDELAGVSDDKRTARFVCAIALALPDGSTYTTRGTIEGIIGYKEAGENGFGYDPIFFLPEYGMTSAELAPTEKNKISHRGNALRAMMKLINED